MVSVHSLLLLLVAELGLEPVVGVGLGVGGDLVFSVLLVGGVVHGLGRGRLCGLQLVGHAGRSLEPRGQPVLLLVSPEIHNDNF